MTSIENNHKNVDSARKGQEVCIKIEPIPGEAPKMFGRHFDEKDFLISKVRQFWLILDFVFKIIKFYYPQCFTDVYKQDR